VRNFRLGLLFFGVGAIGIPLSWVVLGLATVGIDSFFAETLGIPSSGVGTCTSILGVVFSVGCCVWAGWVSVNPAGLRVWPAAVFGGGLIGLGSFVPGLVLYLFLPHMRRAAHHPQHYPFQYVLLGWLTWLAFLAVPIALAYVGAAQAHKRMNSQTVEDEEDGFDPEIDHEPAPVFDEEADSETPPDPE
jgi:hypothetical protein